MSPVNQEPGHTIQNFVWNLVCAQNVHISGCHIRLLSPSTLLDHDKGELGHGSFLENEMVHVDAFVANRAHDFVAAPVVCRFTHETRRHSPAGKRHDGSSSGTS